MKQSLSSFFCSLPEQDIASLEERVLLRLVAEQRAVQALRKKKAILGLSLAVTLTIGIGSLLGGNILQSEFWKFLSLIFSDFSTIAAIPIEFATILLETMPIVPLLMFSAAGFFLFWALDYWIQTLKGSSRYRDVFQFN